WLDRSARPLPSSTPRAGGTDQQSQARGARPQAPVLPWSRERSLLHLRLCPGGAPGPRPASVARARWGWRPAPFALPPIAAPDAELPLVPCVLLPRPSNPLPNGPQSYPCLYSLPEDHGAAP